MTYNPIVFATKAFYPPYATEPVPYILFEAISMVTLSDDEVALIRSLLATLCGIKVRDINKAMVILAKADRREKP